MAVMNPGGSGVPGSDGDVSTFLYNNTHIHVFNGDITEATTDAIVCAANSKLKGSGGLSKAIADKAGNELIQQCKQWVKNNGPVPVTENCITGSGKLKTGQVIHAVGPTDKDASDELQQTFENCLETAEGIRCKTIVLPAISTGYHGLPLDDAAEAMVGGVISYLDNATDTCITDIFLVDIRSEMVQHILASCANNNLSEVDNLAATLSNLHIREQNRGREHEKLAKIVASKGLEILDEKGQGNCQFLAIADQVERNQRRRYSKEQLRKAAIDHMRANPKTSDGTDLSEFIEKNQHWKGWDKWLSYMAQDGSWGDHLTLQALADVLKCDIIVYSSTAHDSKPNKMEPSGVNLSDRREPLTIGLIQERDKAHYVSLVPKGQLPARRSIQANQPVSATMEVYDEQQSLPGYENFGTIRMQFYLPSGVHKNVQTGSLAWYKGCSCTAFLPSNSEGRHVLSLLRRAFEGRLVFGINQHNKLTYNLPLKTSRNDSSRYGYPDPHYLHRVAAELAARGISADPDS